MRILHVTDFHFHRAWFDWLTDQATGYDACCLTGDLLDMFPNGRVGLREQSRWVRKWLCNFPGRLYACTGNHDWWPRSEHVIDTDTEGGWLRKASRHGVIVDGSSEHLRGHHFVC